MNRSSGYGILVLAVVLAAAAAHADTTSSTTHYSTDFSSSSVSNDFCDGAIMELTYNSRVGGQNYSANSSHVFADGSLTTSAKYGGDVFLAVVAGGTQSATLVPVGHTGAVAQAYASGIFTNVAVSLTYTLNNPRVGYDHTDIGSYIAARKNDTPPNATSVGPYPYRVPLYLAWYNGARLSVGEWTYSYQAPPREIAGVDVTIGSDTSTFQLVLVADGGDDNGGVVAGASPCTLKAELWENGTRIGLAEGVDNPYDWANGPEVVGSAFDPAGDYSQGAWSPYAGDWDDNQSWARSNHDIRLGGWVLIGSKQLVSSGTGQGIVATAFSVAPPQAQVGTPGTAILVQ